MLIALMGIALVTASEIYTFDSKRERERELLFVGHQFRAALRSYYLNGGAAPSTSGLKEHPARLEDLLRDPRAPGIRRHLRRVFRDPMTGNAEWGLVLVGGRIVGVHSLSDEEPIKLDGFEPDDRAFRNKKSYREWIFSYPENQLIPASVETTPATPGQVQADKVMNGSAGGTARSTSPWAVDSNKN